MACSVYVVIRFVVDCFLIFVVWDNLIEVLFGAVLGWDGGDFVVVVFGGNVVGVFDCWFFVFF